MGLGLEGGVGTRVKDHILRDTLHLRYPPVTKARNQSDGPSEGQGLRRPPAEPGVDSLISGREEKTRGGTSVLGLLGELGQRHASTCLEIVQYWTSFIAGLCVQLNHSLGAGQGFGTAGP